MIIFIISLSGPLQFFFAESEDSKQTLTQKHFVCVFDVCLSV